MQCWLWGLPIREIVKRNTSDAAQARSSAEMVHCSRSLCCLSEGDYSSGRGREAEAIPQAFLVLGYFPFLIGSSVRSFLPRHPCCTKPGTLGHGSQEMEMLMVTQSRTGRGC